MFISRCEVNGSSKSQLNYTTDLEKTSIAIFAYNAQVKREESLNLLTRC